MRLHKDEEVKQAIHDAARRVFQKWGLNKTTMEDIAHEAGKGKSTLYYYYKSKEEIFESVVANEMNVIVDKATIEVNKCQTAREKFKRYVMVVLAEIKQTVSIYPIVTGELKSNKGFIERIQKQLDSKEEAFIKEIILFGITSGEFRSIKKKDLDKAANVMMGIIRGLELYLFLDNDDHEKIEIATKMISEGM